MKHTKNLPLIKLRARATICSLIFIVSQIVLAQSHPSANQKPKYPQVEIDFIAGEVVDTISTNLEQWSNRPDIQGLAIAIVNAEKILWKKEFGFITDKEEIPVNPETLFSLQSISKSFAALAILKAVQDSLLNLDIPISTYLPDFTVNSIYDDHPERLITLRHLLAHQAGFTHEAPIGSNFDNTPHTFEQHIESISSTWLKFPVGYRIAYSNLGIDLAGFILQEKSGMPFSQYVYEKILKPMGMTSSTLDMLKIKASKNRAQGMGFLNERHSENGDIPIEIPMIPSGGVYSNILDMAKYLRFFINHGMVNGKQLIDQKLIEQMTELAYPVKTQRSGYGLCLMREVVSNTYFLSHGGGGYGFSAQMIIYPELKLGLVALLNTRGNDLFDKIQAAIIENIEEEVSKTEPMPTHMSKANYSHISLDDNRIKNIFGIYDKTWTIKPYNDGLGISPDGINFYPLKMYLDEDQIVGSFGNYSEIRFLPLKNNSPGTMVYLHRMVDNVIFRDFHMPLQSADTPGPNKPEWIKYTGNYEIKKWGRKVVQNYSIYIQNGYLYLNWMRCHEHLPGLFFTYNGEALDFRGDIPTFRNIKLYGVRPSQTLKNNKVT